MVNSFDTESAALWGKDDKLRHYVMRQYNKEELSRKQNTQSYTDVDYIERYSESVYFIHNRHRQVWFTTDLGLVRCRKSQLLPKGDITDTH